MVSKQNMIAIMAIIAGVGLTQLKPEQPFTVGLGIGTIAIASLWIILLIVKDLKKK